MSDHPDEFTLQSQLAAEHAAHERTERRLEEFQESTARRSIEAHRLTEANRLLRIAIATTFPHIPDDVRAGIDALLGWLDADPAVRSAAAHGRCPYGERHHDEERPDELQLPLNQADPLGQECQPIQALPG